MLSVSHFNRKHFANRCSEVHRRSVLPSERLLLLYIHSYYKLSPDVHTCQSCRSSCALTKPAGAFLLHSHSVLPISAPGVRTGAGCWEAELQPHCCQLRGAAGQGEKRKGKAPNSSSKGKDRGKAGLALTTSLSVSVWIVLKQFNVWSGSTGSSFMPRLHCSYQSQCHTSGVTVQRKCPSAVGPSHQNWYQSQLSWAHNSPCSSLQRVCLIAMNKPQETGASHSSC